MTEDKKLVDDIVSSIFDEFQEEIWAKTKLHQSEEVNKDLSDECEISSMKVHEFINPYHLYCNLCEHHLYSRSVENDINSFFQKHINTEYHQFCKSCKSLPEDVPMISWEEKWVTGRCNVCEMSGLDSYIIDTDFNHTRFLAVHNCFWTKQYKEGNDKFLRKLRLLKKYCGLSFFYSTFIKTEQEKTTCTLCGVTLTGTVERFKYHLGTNAHYQNFIEFVWKVFNFSLKDLLNGFYLERVTKWIVTSWSEVPLGSGKREDLVDRDKCLEESNKKSDLYPLVKGNFSFSPRDIDRMKKILNCDVVSNNTCLLCNVPFGPNHLNLGSHKLKMDEISTLASEDLLKKFSKICENQRKRLGRYKKILETLNRTSVTPGSSPINTKGLSPHRKYFINLFMEKLALVEHVFTETNEKISYCEICDRSESSLLLKAHLDSYRHRDNVSKWEEVKKYLENPKFMEPFQKVEDNVVCFLCGEIFLESSLFAHLKGRNHTGKFLSYSKISFPIPISSCLRLTPGFTLSCLTCNTILYKGVAKSSLMSVLQTQPHWPCPFLKAQDPNDSSKNVNDKDLSSLDVIYRSEDGFVLSSMDLAKVKKNIESIVDAFEKKIILELAEKSIPFINQLNNRENLRSNKILSEGEEPTGQNHERQLTASEEKSSVESEHAPQGVNATVNSKSGKSDAKGKENGTEVKTNTSTNEKAEKKNGEKTEEREGDEDFEEEHEVLIVKGVPKHKMRSDLMYYQFNKFGKIRYIFFEGNLTIVSFAKAGVAESVVKGPPIKFDGLQLKLEVTRRKSRAAASQYGPLQKDISHLLQHPFRLLTLIHNLVLQSTSVSQSKLEIAREEVVCRTIIEAVRHMFPHSRCFPFGSRLSGLTLNNSDLDVFMDSGGSYDGFTSKTGQAERELVKKVADILRRKKEITDINVVDRARVPIVSFLHKPTQIHCDLSFKNGLSVQNTLLIRFMLSLDWRVKPLILFLKYWANLNGIHGPPYFSSYAIAMMVIFYLQQLPSPVLPTIESLQKSFEGHRLTIGGWDCSFNSNTALVPKTENNEPVPELLVGFFKFYANFDYANYVISPLTGQPLPRDALTRKIQLPMSYKRHIINLPVENLVPPKFAICILDPFDLSHILTKSFTKRSLGWYVHLCNLSHEYLNTGLKTPLVETGVPSTEQPGVPPQKAKSPTS